MKIWFQNKSKTTSHLFFWRALQVLGKQGMVFVIFLICAKLLSPNELGLYSYILAIISFLVMFGEFGIATATFRYVAEYYVTDKRIIKSILFNSIVIVGSISFIVSIITIIIGQWLFSQYYQLLLYLVPLIILIPLNSLYDGIYRGLSRFKRLAIVSLTVGIATLFLVYFLILKIGLTGALIAQNVFYLLTLIFLVAGHHDISFKFDYKLMKRIGKYAILVGLANLGYFLYSRIGVVMLGAFGYISQIAYYEIVDKIFRLTLLTFIIYGTVVAVGNIKKYKLKKYRALYSDIVKTTYTSFIIGIIIMVILYFTVPLLIKQFFYQYYTADFVQIFKLFLLIIPLAIVEAVLASGYMTPLGYVKILTVTIFIGGIISVFANYVLVLHLGYIGIIYATIIIHNITNIVKIGIFMYKFNQLP